MKPDDFVSIAPFICVLVSLLTPATHSTVDFADRMEASGTLALGCFK